jgi:choline dehydrogenase-like flavoprotein
MHFLNDDQRETLSAFCETIHPGFQAGPGGQSPVSPGARELRIAELVEKTLLDRDDRLEQQRLRRLLTLLDQRVVNGLLAGRWAPFAHLPLHHRTQVLQALANSRFNAARGAFHRVKMLVSFLAYANTHAARDNPFWSVINYPGRAHSAAAQSDHLPTLTIDQAQEVACDVLVIGSGAGGGVVAAELAAAGCDVIIAEKGDYFSNSALPKTEMEGMRRLYEGGGSMTTADRSIVVLAGSTLGGGTTVNWMTCLPPPESVLHEWSRELGFHAATSNEFAHSLNLVSRRIHVTTDESEPNYQNDVLERGCRALGYSVTVIPRNVKGCVECDFCGFGCRYGAKQDTRLTFLRDATRAGARIIVRAHADRLSISNGFVQGALLSVTDAAGNRHELNVRCRMVVVAAGSIHTPAILLRSGLTNPHVGANLHLHPTGAMFARYHEPVLPWKGPPQTRVCEHFADLDGEGYGIRIEASPAHPGLWALGLPWQSGEQHRTLMHQLPYLANSIFITRDRHGGRVRVDSQGRPRLHYRLHPDDARHFMEGVAHALRIHHAAGAAEVFGPHNNGLSFRRGQDTDFEAFVRRVQQHGTRPNHVGIFCAHQLSSCRIAASAARGAINPEGESFEVRNLYVADASALPTATGVNPMLTIMATAHHLAQHMKQRLGV